MKHFFDQTPETLDALCGELGLPQYAPAQLLEWVYRRGVDDLNEMTNISRANRALLSQHVEILRGVEVARQSATDGTEKILIGWPARETASEARLAVVARATQRETECVMIPTERRRTACVSSQVGCPVGCAFCASGIGGLEGNLSRGQIVEQVFRLSHRSGPSPSEPSPSGRGQVSEGDSPGRGEGELRAGHIFSNTPSPPTPLPRGEGGRISHIVFMGMGEPLANFAAVTGAVRTLNAEWGFGISARRITISTVGLPDAIRKLVNFELPVTLALSLHAPNDELRRRLIPWANYTTIVELLDACDEYFRKTGREITLEYILLRHVNDRPEHARELAALARRLRSNVNLIRYNEVRGLPFERPATEDVRQFQEILRSRGVNAHIRRSRGRDIAAACGQLRHERQTAAG